MFQDYITEFFKHTKNLRIVNTKLLLVRGLLLPKLIFGYVNIEKIDISLGGQ